MRQIAFGIALALAPAAFGQAFSGLGFLPGGSATWAKDISEDGLTVVGDSPTESWRWTLGGGMATLGTLPGYTSQVQAGGVSRDGSVITGDAFNPTLLARLPFRWTSAGIGQLDGQNCGSLGIGLSGSGVVAVGSSSLEIAFRSTGGVRQNLGPLLGTPFGAGSSSVAFAASYDGSVIVGSAQALRTPPQTEVFTPFRWTAATGMQAMLNNGQLLVSASATDVSSDGLVIVGGDSTRIFRWTQPAGYQFITPVGSLFGPVHVSGDGTTIITDTTVWTAATGARSLNQWLTGAGCNYSGWSLTAVTGISFDGRVLCGEGTDPSGQREAWVATVPTPSSCAVLLTVLCAPRRRRSPASPCSAPPASS